MKLSSVSIVAVALLTSVVFSAVRGIAQQTIHSVTMSVRVLPTTYGLPDESPPVYPETITVDVPMSLQLAAYGAAAFVWLGPPSWTGNAAVGVDGSESVHLFPAGSDGSTGPRIIYEADTGCEGCKETRAALFFREAMDYYNRTDNFDGKYPLPIPRGLVVRRGSKDSASYTLPNERNLRVRGAVFWETESFQQIELRLPPADVRLAEFLLTDFSKRVVRRFHH